MSILKRLFGDGRDRAGLRPLYAAIVAEGRAPGWYRDAGVPDTLDGRFDMIAAVLSMVLARLEAEPPRGPERAALLTELFVEDMDGQLRELGVGDVSVGKHVGAMMSALGGRLGAYRAGLEPGGDLDGAVVRNLFRGADAPGAPIVATGLRALHSGLTTLALDDVLGGRLRQ
jgi:cytochrome b pre-mRNA-processing protein 3